MTPDRLKKVAENFGFALHCSRFSALAEGEEIFITLVFADAQKPLDNLVGPLVVKLNRKIPSYVAPPLDQIFTDQISLSPDDLKRVQQSKKQGEKS